MLSACATTRVRGGGVPDPAANRAALQARAVQWWDALQAEDWGRAYDLDHPERRTQNTRAEYIAWRVAHEPFRTHAYTLRGVQLEPDGDLGWVQLDLATSFRRMPNAPVQHVERWDAWERLDGTWYPVPPAQRPAFPAPPAERDFAREAELKAQYPRVWQARHAGDLHALYARTDPADRARVPFERFAEIEGQFEYSAYRITWVEVIGERGRMRMQYDRKMVGAGMTKAPVTHDDMIERWVVRDGVWYLDELPDDATPAEPTADAAKESYE